MYPTVRSTASDAFDVRLSTTSNPSWPKYFLLAILWIAAALFLLATTGARAGTSCTVTDSRTIQPIPARSVMQSNRGLSRPR